MRKAKFRAEGRKPENPGLSMVISADLLEEGKPELSLKLQTGTGGINGPDKEGSTFSLCLPNSALPRLRPTVSSSCRECLLKSQSTAPSLTPPGALHPLCAAGPSWAPWHRLHLLLRALFPPPAAALPTRLSSQFTHLGITSPD